MALKTGILQGDMLINLDSEEEGILTAGSAGGENIDVILPIKKVSSDVNFSYKIKLQGFFGGHSGSEIHKNRKNSNKALNEILALLNEKSDIYLVSVSGGGKDNAIPRTAEAVISSSEEIKSAIETIVEEIKGKYIKDEPQTEILVEKVEKINETLDKESTDKYISLLEEIPTGVYSFMKEYPEIVEASDNVAIVKTGEDNIRIITSMRSSEPHVLEELKEKIVAIAEKYNASYEFSAKYPEWRYRSESVLREKAVDAWKELTGNDMVVQVIHAGLECGAIMQQYPDMDFISIGPDMQDVHTPEEKLDIVSTEKIYNYIIKLLKDLK